MNILDTINKRKSIRNFQKKEIPDDIIRKILEAARLAPSGTNAQPSRYIVIKDKETKEMLKKNKIFVQELVYDAPLIIVCCADPDVYPKATITEGDELPLDENRIRAVRDVSIASAYMVLEATELGLGSCYIGWMYKQKAKKILGIPENFVLPHSIIFGYTDEKGIERKRNPMEKIVHNEKW